MKRILAIALIICLVLTLAGCGGSSASEPKSSDKTSAEQRDKTAEDSSSGAAKGETQETVIKTGIGENGGEVAVKSDGDIAWDPEKMGGMPQPEGTTVFMEMDMSKILGQEFAYSYSVIGLTKEVYQEYIKLATNSFPNVIENTLSDKEGSFIAATKDLEKQFSVRFLEGNLSVIQYVK